MLPSPYDYENWQEFASALLAALTEEGIEGTAGGTSGAVPPVLLPGPPDGFQPIFWNDDLGHFYLGDDFYAAIDTVTPVTIDTQSLALAAVELNTIADNAISTAKIIDLAVINAKIANATILSAKIGNAQIVNALIADLAVNTAKIGDAAILTAKIADAQILSAKIANLAVGGAHIQAAAIATAHIGDAQVVNAKIGDTIQSGGWNETTKQGWHIDKLGNIRGSGIAIYNAAGDIVFGTSGTVDFAAITGVTRPADNATVGATIGTDLLGQFSAANIATFMANLTLGTGLLQDLAITAGKLANASVVYGSATISGFGSFASISQITSGNVSTFIASAAIGGAFIANAAILNAHIADATILTAKIGDAQIVSAKIGAAAIGGTHIQDGVITAPKINVASLAAVSATIGLLRTASSGARLEVESNQIRVYDAANVLRVRMGVWA